jgi:hypothetical protein
MSKFSYERKAKCARREVSKREWVYSRKNEGKPLTPQQLEEIAVMTEIAEDYEQLHRESDTDMFGDL